MSESSESLQPATSEPEAIDEAIGVEVVTDHIIGMSFDKTTRAEEVLLNMVHLAKEGEISLSDAVVVYKDDNERVHVRQTVDITPGRGALSGALWGLLIGSFLGPAGLIVGAGAGAASGGLAGKLIDVGLDDDWVKQVGGWISPGTSALLLLVADEVRPVVVRELSRFEGTVLYCTFPEAVRRELVAALSYTKELKSPDDHRMIDGVLIDEPGN